MVTYQVLARKWRPKSFASLKGQEHITRALMNAIARGQLHHAYLFTGTRGVGKTTIARILAKCFNCLTGVTATPCGECSACCQIDTGSFVDLIEVDAASRTRVEDTRELLENVQYAPTCGRFKIYLIDEVHMLSGHSFNALLKTLEEPPPHVKFILATTDPDRIPVTVLSRCLRLSLKALSVPEITTQLEEILSAENLAYEQKALIKIAQAAQGSMRDALSLLEQARAFCVERIQVDAVEEMLGVSYQRYLSKLVAALLEMDIKSCLQLTEKMVECGADFSQVLSALGQILHALAVAQLIPNPQEIHQFSAIDEALLDLKDKLAPEEVQLLYQMVIAGQRDLNFAPDPRTAFEMILIRMVIFRPAAPAPVMPIATLPVSKAPPPPPIKEILAPKPVVVAAAVVAAPVVAAPIIASQTDPLDWSQIIGQLSLTGLNLILVKNCVVGKWDGNRLALCLDPLQKACLNAARQTQIEVSLSQYFGRPIKLTITVGPIEAATPMMQAQAAQAQRQVQATQQMTQDKNVQQIIATFDATVEKITVIDSTEN